ncbi:MAG: TonB-dependent receptor [Chromatiales bacterium]|nr:TonB-dependent receptor [Chromatiales bacterium]
MAGLAVLLADPAVALDDAPRADLPTIEVIGRRRVPGPLDAVTIDAEALQSATTRNLAQAMQLVPGVTVNRIGARNEALIKLRGFDSRQVPLFIDGVPVYVPYDGNIDLSRLAVGDIQSLRVTRGGGSVLYGPNALGGTINVVTARPEAGLSLYTRASQTLDDSLDAQRSEVGGRIGYAGEHWYVQASAFQLDSDFFRLSDDFRVPDPTFDVFPGQPGVQPTEDGGRRGNSAFSDLTTSVKLGYVADGGAEFAVGYVRLDGEKQNPPYIGPPPNAGGVRPRFWRWPYYDKETFYAVGAVPVAGDGWVRGRAYYDTFQNLLRSFDNDTYTTQNTPPAFNSAYDDYTWGGSLETELSTWGDSGTTRAIAHFKQDVHRETDDDDAPLERIEDQTWSFALEHEHRVTGALTLTGGVAYNILNAQRAENNANGVLVPFDLEDESAFNLQLGAGYEVGEWLLGVNLSRKTRFPTLKDRYSFRLGSALPNPGLQDEVAEQVELSARGGTAGFDVGLTLFGSWLDDAIATVALPDSACTSPPCTQLQNVGRQRHLGGELSLSRALPVVGNVSLDYAYVSIRNQEQPLLPTYTPRHTLRAASRTPLGDKARLLVELRSESGRYSSSGGPQNPVVRSTAGFGLLNAGVEWDVWRNLRLLVEAANLTDRLYAIDDGFPEAGRTYSATLVWRQGETR